jgi:type II secretory pathway component GspD/PulD (secretin)
VPWEYKYAQFGDADYERKANELGKDGWEMVTAVGGSNFFFKRPKAVQAAAFPAKNPRAAQPGPGEEGAADAGGMEVITLKNADANAVVTALTTLFAGRSVIAPVGQSNSLIVRANKATLDEIKKLVEQLDAQPTKGTRR